MKRILVVDDDESVVRFLERGLGLEGFEVVGCVTTEAALNSFNGGNFDLVILDWVMPGVAGDELMLRLRHRKAVLPVIVLSARNTAFDQDRILKSGANACFGKPFDYSALLINVRALLARES